MLRPTLALRRVSALACALLLFACHRDDGQGGDDLGINLDANLGDSGLTLVITPQNPTIIVEVLSSTTEQYDRGLKWVSYQRLPSLTDYVLVSQLEPQIEHYRRDAGGRWSYRSFGPGERLELTDGAVLDVDAIFAGVFELPGD